jgi:hypothetical protein
MKKLFFTLVILACVASGVNAQKSFKLYCVLEMKINRYDSIGDYRRFDGHGVTDYFPVKNFSQSKKS